MSVLKSNSDSSDSDSIDFKGYEYDPSVDMSGYIPLSERMKVTSVSCSDIGLGRQSILSPVVESKFSGRLSEAINEIRFGSFDPVRLVGHYQVWLRTHYTVVLHQWNPFKHEDEYLYFRSPKRGSKRYALRVIRRFDKVCQRVPDVEFFGYGYRGRVESSCLLITLTYGRNISLKDAWGRLGEDLNRFISGLRGRYGKIAVFRVWESHEDCYPHIHLLVLFSNHVFNGSSHVGKSGELTYRVFETRFENGREIRELDKIKSYWGQGHSDVLMVCSVKSGFRYVKKYLVKSVRFKGFQADKREISKSVKTLACCWVFRKRSFAVSGSWSLPDDLITVFSNSKAAGDHYSCLDGSKLTCTFTDWRLFGFYKGDHVLLPVEFGHLNEQDGHRLVGDEHFKLYVKRDSYKQYSV